MGIGLGLLGSGTAWAGQAGQCAQQQPQAATQDVETEWRQYAEQWKERAQCLERRAQSALDDAAQQRRRAQLMSMRLASLESTLAQRPIIRESVLFKTNATKPIPGSQQAVAEVAQALKSAPSMPVIVEGHTDSVGSAQHNQALSEARALEVKRELVQQGIPESQIQVRAFGENNPEASNASVEGRAVNRRVDIEVGGSTGSQ